MNIFLSERNEGRGRISPYGGDLRLLSLLLHQSSIKLFCYHFAIKLIIYGLYKHYEKFQIKPRYETMEIDTNIKIEVKDGVYNPAEDSFLLIKTLNVKGNKKALL